MPTAALPPSGQRRPAPKWPGPFGMGRHGGLRRVPAGGPRPLRVLVPQPCLAPSAVALPPTSPYLCSRPLSQLANVSKWLRKERELAFYGDIDFIPSEEYERGDAERAISDAKLVFDAAARLIASSNDGCEGTKITPPHATGRNEE